MQPNVNAMPRHSAEAGSADVYVWMSLAYLEEICVNVEIVPGRA